jgi:WD40 repeat protein/tRNA A-37 threonylcarbamoyl transferase component Bud32
MSDDNRFQRLSDIFERALAAPVAERPAILDAECNGDTALRAEIESLLGHADKPDDPVITAAGLDALFEEAGLRPRTNGVLPSVVGGNHNTPNTPSNGAAAGFGAPAGTQMPLLTGQYRILRVVGEGGMGIVYEAEQSFPKRRVALKAMRPGIFSRRMLRRFQNEAHILGRLQHPGIAQIYEAGASDPQHPDDAFFVMEFVDGLPLTAWADQKNLSTRERLELFAKVCDAVHHAHQRGVIHRDLKPANILVTEMQGEGAGVAQPKVLDFGVARVVDEVSHAAGRPDTLHTGAGQLIGTLAYMPPEQISTSTGEKSDPDVRSDVYALGVTLYQLLSGRLPLDLADKSIPDAAQMIRDSAPSRLGTIDRTYRGDLETIVAKAMDKDRERRYQTAAGVGGLADDIRRYLAGEAISAKRDSAIYVFRKQIKRNKKAVAVAILALAGIVAFAVTAAIQARHNATLASTLADQLTVANSDRGRLLTVAGTPALGERTLWVEFLQRPDLKETYWALWEYYSRQPILRSTGGAGLQPGPAALTPDGKIVVRTSRNGDMQGWTSDLKTCLWRAGPDGDTWHDVQMLPDGRAFIAVGGNGKLVAVEPRTGEVLFRSREVGEMSIGELAVRGDGKVFYTADRSGDILEWSSRDWSILRRFPKYGDTIGCIAVSPDGRDLVIGNRRGRYGVMNLAKAQILGNIPIKSTTAYHPYFSPDGGAFFALTSDATVHIFETNDWAEVSKFSVNDPSTYSITLLPDATLLTCGKSGGLKVWDIPAQRLLAELPGDEGSLGSIFGGPAPRTFYTTGVGTAIRLWESTPLNCVRSLPQSGTDWVLTVRPSPDGRLIAAGDSAGMLRLWDAATGSLIAECKGPAGHARSICWTPLGDHFFVGFSSGEIGRFSASESSLTIESVWTAHRSDICALSLDTAGVTLASAATRGEVKLWGAVTRQPIRSLETGQDMFHGAALNPGGTLIATAGRRPGIAVYDTHSGTPVFTIPDEYINWKARFSPDGSIIAAARAKAEIDIIDAKTFKRLRTLRGHATSIIEITFDPTGRLLASGSADKTWRLWDVASGHALLTLESGAEVSAVSFMPDSRSVVTCGPNGRVQIWDLTYYDRHIAGNMAYCYHKLSPLCPAPPRTDLLLEWGRKATGRPDFSLDDPSAAVPLGPPVMGSPTSPIPAPTPVMDK